MRMPKWWWRVLTLAHRAALADQTRAAAFGGRGGGVHDMYCVSAHPHFQIGIRARYHRRQGPNLTRNTSRVTASAGGWGSCLTNRILQPNWQPSAWGNRRPPSCAQRRCKYRRALWRRRRLRAGRSRALPARTARRPCAARAPAQLRAESVEIEPAWSPSSHLRLGPYLTYYGVDLARAGPT